MNPLTEKSNLIHNIDTLILRRLKERLGFILFMWLLTGPFILIGILLLFGVYPTDVTENGIALELLNGVHFVYFIISGVLITSFMYYFKQYLNSVNADLNETISYLENGKINIDETTIILSKVNTIHTLVQRLIRKRFYIRILLGNDVYNRYTTLIESLFRYLQSILQDLQSDLHINVDKVEEDLLMAKSEVEKSIHGTTELEKVSELQQARLNRQIEQFEELQRVLVKV